MRFVNSYKNKKKKKKFYAVLVGKFSPLLVLAVWVVHRLEIQVDKAPFDLLETLGLDLQALANVVGLPERHALGQDNVELDEEAGPKPEGLYTFFFPPNMRRAAKKKKKRKKASLKRTRTVSTALILWSWLQQMNVSFFKKSGEAETPVSSSACSKAVDVHEWHV